MILPNKNLSTVVVIFLLICCGVGIFFRFYEITQDQFTYYDEGLWLGKNRPILELVEAHPPKSFSELKSMLGIMWKQALATDKSLWVFLTQLRVFFVGVDGWFFVRLLSAIFGTLTLGAAYLFSNKLLQSRVMALFATACLALFPSHVYYSRVGLQEGMSTFFFLAGLYFYLFPRKLGVRIFLSALLMGCVFLSNYRMIIIPFFLLCVELYVSFALKEKISWRKWVYHSLVFVGVIVGIGSLHSGLNTYVTFGWMFRQADLAKGTFEIFNILSYPYYLFRLEGVAFGLLFFANVWLLVKRQWMLALPFMFVSLFMGVFSLPQEKGVRYLTAVMPLMAMAPAFFIKALWQESLVGKKWFRMAFCILIILMIGQFFIESLRIIQFHNGYHDAMVYLEKKDPMAKVISSQEMNQKLHRDAADDVIGPPKQIQLFLRAYSQGYRYLIIEPQAYVSLTDSEKRFDPPLHDFYGFIRKAVPPVKVMDHFSEKALERFVLEHNESLRRSLKFLAENDGNRYGKLYIYDVRVCLALIKQLMSAQGGGPKI